MANKCVFLMNKSSSNCTYLQIYKHTYTYIHHPIHCMNSNAWHAHCAKPQKKQINQFCSVLLFFCFVFFLNLIARIIEKRMQNTEAQTFHVITTPTHFRQIKLLAEVVAAAAAGVVELAVFLNNPHSNQLVVLSVLHRPHQQCNNVSRRQVLPHHSHCLVPFEGEFSQSHPIKSSKIIILEQRRITTTTTARSTKRKVIRQATAIGQWASCITLLCTMHMNQFIVYFFFFDISFLLIHFSFIFSIFRQNFCSAKFEWKKIERS